MARIHPLMKACVVVLLWLAIGTLTYWLVGNSSTVSEFTSGGGVTDVTYDSWTFSQSFYYAVQAGLCVGFGMLVETQEGSRLFTVFYMLAGSSFIVGALVYFIQLSLTKQENWMSDMERKLAKFSAGIKADGYRGFNIKQLHELMLCYPEHMRDVCLRLEEDYQVVCNKMKAFKKAGLQERAKMVDDVLKDACDKLEEFKDNALSISGLVKIHLQVATWKQRTLRFFSAHSTMATEIVAFVCWLLLGWVYMCAFEGASFITGLYFAVSTLSSAGLYGVTSTASGSAYWFASVYCIVGVPLYAILLGSYANILVEQYNEEQLLETIHSRMNGAEIAFLKHLVKTEHKEMCDFGDYVELQLLRLGKVDRDFLEQLRADFNKFEADADGKVAADALLSESQKTAVMHEKTVGAANSSTLTNSSTPVAEP